MQRSNFTLSKWYMDCVSDAGDVFIGYAATLRWKALSIDYSSLLEQPVGRATQTRTSLLGSSTPILNGSHLSWNSASLGASGTWRPRSGLIDQIIFESEAGKVAWRCMAPLAMAEIHTKDQPNLSGLGYAEHISITIPPWKLPMDELRWGRFLSERAHLTWIDWQGSYPMTLVFYNGVLVDNSTVTDDEIGFPGGRLEISSVARRLLRQGTLVSTALSVVPGIQHIVPRRILDAHETKWCSRGKLNIEGERFSEGWVIHECVRWGN